MELDQMIYADCLTIGHDQTVQDAYHFAATLLKEHLDGLGMKVRIIPQAGLGTEPQMLRKVTIGDIDLAVITVANAADLVPELGFFSLPYLFAGEEHFKESVLNPSFADRIRAFVERRCKEIEIIAIVTPGVRNLYSVRPVEDLHDLIGMKVRVMSSPVDFDVWRSWHAEPHPMAFGRIANAIRDGTVEAAEDTSAVYFAQRHYELAGNFALTGHQWSVGFVVMNRRRYCALRPETAQRLSAFGRTMGAEVIAYAVKSARSAARELERRKDVRITRPDIEALKSKSLDLRRDVATRLGMLDVLNFLNPCD